MRPQDKHKCNPYLYPLLQRLQRNVRYLRLALHLTLDCALPLPSRTPYALFDFTPRCLWRVQVYDNCRLIDGAFLRKQDEILAWLGSTIPAPRRIKRTTMWMYYASFANSAYLRRHRVDIERQQKHA